MAVLPSSTGTSASIPTPSPSAVDLQGSVTGAPYILTTSPINFSTAITHTSGDRAVLTWEKGIGAVVAGVTVLTLVI